MKSILPKLLTLLFLLLSPIICQADFEWDPANSTYGGTSLMNGFKADISCLVKMKKKPRDASAKITLTREEA